MRARLEQTWQAWAQGTGHRATDRHSTRTQGPRSYYRTRQAPSIPPMSSQAISTFQVRQGAYWLSSSDPVTHLPEAKFVSSRGHILPPALIGRLG